MDKIIKRPNFIHCFYQPTKGSLIDLVNPTTGNGWYSGDSFEKIAKDYPDYRLEIWDHDAAIFHSENLVKGPVEGITKTRFWDALECLPPVDWFFCEDNESFKFMERFRGNITSIYARLGKRYFMFFDNISLPHAEVIKRCEDYINNEDK